jgi:hypothetical protein
MSKNPDNFDDDRTEFNFSDTADDVTPAPMKASPSVTRASGGGFSSVFGNALSANGNKRKLILLAVGSIVLILAIFKILEWAWAPSSKPASSTQVTSAPLLSPPAAPPVQTASLQPAKTEINLMDETNRAQNQQLDKTHQKIAQLEMTLEDVQTQLAMMSQLVQAMSQQLQQQTASKAAKSVPEKKSETKREKVIAEKKAAEEPVYYIQAMVQGRVWLANQKGTTTTLSVGDEVPGYGRINVIDLEQGIVMTDQGKTIRYHSGDR